MHLEFTHLGYSPRTFKLPRKQVYLVKFLAVFMWLKTTFHIDFVNVGL